MKNTLAILLMPPNPSYAPVRDVVIRVLRDLGYQTASADQAAISDAQWVNVTTDAIQQADLIVADVSDRDPNVMYDLGFAHALRKPTLLLLSTASSGKLPSDLFSYQMLTYDPNQIESLRQQVYSFAGYLNKRLSGEA